MAFIFCVPCGPTSKWSGTNCIQLAAERGEVPGEEKTFLVLLVVPEIGDLNVHVHGRFAGIDRGKIKLEWHTGLEGSPQLAPAPDPAIAHGLAARAARQAARKAGEQSFRGFDSSSSLHYGTVIVKVRVAESFPRKAVAPL